jgi:hypothetical protein
MSIQEIDDQLFDAREALRDLIKQAPLGDDLTIKAREALIALFEIRMVLLSVHE